jgi:hypothetical protein
MPDSPQRFSLTPGPLCEHTACPDGYLNWDAWAREMAKTHRQQRCPRCGLWAIWVLNGSARRTMIEDGPAVAQIAQALEGRDE